LHGGPVPDPIKERSRALVSEVQPERLRRRVARKRSRHETLDGIQLADQRTNLCTG
jgi:hypothetical protein